MGNCCHCRRSNRVEPSDNCHKKIVLLLVGLDNAGKTTVAKRLAGEPVDEIVPTVGFSSISLKYKGYEVMIYDLGGGQQIRGIWHRYFMDAYGIIFVVDAFDSSKLEECRSTFENLLQHDKLSGKPVLLLANKQDCSGALDELDIVDKLNVERVVNERRCPTLVETCSAAPQQNVKRKTDPAIHNGYRWLVNCIINNYKNLNMRVERDVAEQKKLDSMAKKERLERIQRLREERKNLANANGNAEPVCQEEENSDGDVVMTDPYKPIAEIVTLSRDNCINKDTQELIQETGSENLAVNISNPKKFLKRVRNGSVSFGEDKSLIGKLRSTIDINVNKNIKSTAFPTEMTTAWQFPQGGGGDGPHQRLPPLRPRHLSEPWVQPSLRLPAKDCAWDLDKSLEIVPAPETQDTQTEESNKS